jgi:hypothetical protein
MMVIGRIRLIGLIGLIAGLMVVGERLMVRPLVGAGEMNFAPTMWVETSDGEAFEGRWKRLRVMCLRGAA